MSTAVGMGTSPGLKLYARGKVRDIYEVGEGRLVLVASDRISAFDVVLPTQIPGKGEVLNRLSEFWFHKTEHLIPNHFLTTDVDAFPAEARQHAAALRGRSMLVRRARRVDVECVARGYLAGSAWAEYRRQGTVCGQPLPSGLVESQQLPEPIFTPTTKAETGHDQPLTPQELDDLAGPELAGRLRVATLRVYSFAAAYARERGIIIADTKMEFGLLPGDGADGGTLLSARSGEAELILIDELLTPDSSRFWDAAAYRLGSLPPSYDKQYVRDYLEGTGWNKEPPAPKLPPEVVSRTQEKYWEALRRLAGGEA